MPVHDWTRVEGAIFYSFHHDWITEITRALNRGLLPPSYYALSEQFAGGVGPDVLRVSDVSTSPEPPSGGVALALDPPATRFRISSESNRYAARAKAVAIRHVSRHQVVAMVEILSPGNKNNQNGFDAFVRKARDMLAGGVHLLLVDLFPPSSRDPHGIHPAVWGDDTADFELPSDMRLTCAAYRSGDDPEAFVEPVGVNDPLPVMPLFITQETYVRVPLEATYNVAWEGMPAYWRGVLTS